MDLPKEVQELIRMALAEDIGPGDVTARFFVPENARARARVVARETGVLAGLPVAEAVFRAVDPGLSLTSHKRDGDPLAPGDTVLEIAGSTRSLLTAERTALNFLQRLSGIATRTAAGVAAIARAGGRTQLLDTRKTTPGWRWLEKGAVRAGGGRNHRVGLHDMVMVKDNHLPQSGGLGGLQSSIDAVQAAHPGMRVELEADTVEQVRGFLTLRGVDFILLDNMSLEEMRECVLLAESTGVKLEASGGITLERLPEIAATGVDFISSGALTHSVKALDLALDFEERLA
ncbi:MAG: carboxylating nicotinate-nucleotide diphosphorylase [Verrucomicrobiaceae bacterium]|nr:MAG: carboxylating nicotinate-nucleotide diphosphorylase [Verrucomicrobiaceae bacterium]